MTINEKIVIQKAVTRLEILLGRMRGCEEEHPDTHRVSLLEIPTWIEEFKELLKQDEKK